MPDAPDPDGYAADHPRDADGAPIPLDELSPAALAAVCEARTFRVADESGEGEVHPDPWWKAVGGCDGRTVVLTWADLAAANDHDTMIEIARIGEREHTVLGMCSPIERVT